MAFVVPTKGDGAQQSQSPDPWESTDARSSEVPCVLHSRSVSVTTVLTEYEGFFEVVENTERECSKRFGSVYESNGRSGGVSSLPARQSGNRPPLNERHITFRKTRTHYGIVLGNDQHSVYFADEG